MKRRRHGDTIDWNERYAQGDAPWDTGFPSTELVRLLDRHRITPSGRHKRILDIGCGTGTNTVYLSQRGFTPTGIDVSPLAIARAKARARAAGVRADLRVGDLTRRIVFDRPFPLLFDRGVYHFMRRAHLAPFLRFLKGATHEGSLYLVIAGNSNDPDSHLPGPPRVTAGEMTNELEKLFELVALREMKWDEIVVEGEKRVPWGWSGVFRRRRG